MLVPFLLFAVGSFAAPFVGVGFLTLCETFNLSRGNRTYDRCRKRCSLPVALHGTLVSA